jgi:hypothetical protein
MPYIHEIKQREVADTPVLLFDLLLTSGETEFWSTHQLNLDGRAYQGRVLRHNLFDLRSLSDDGSDSVPRLALQLDNTDSRLSQLERAAGIKGAKLTVRFGFVAGGQQTSETRVVFRGIANSLEESTESTARLSFLNRLSLQRTYFPNVRIQRLCPWSFPTSLAQREEGVSGGDEGKYSEFFRCGYSPDVSGGAGNLSGSEPFVSCKYTRSDCQARGMFSVDASNRPTRRFGGFEFVPASILVKGAGDKGSHASALQTNEGKYNDFVPMVYGTAWYRPPVVFSRNDGNLTRMEVLLGMGQIEGVLKVAVNGIEIPAGRANAKMTGTGWFNIVSHGNRTGNFNLDFADGSGAPLGDPYGSMAYLSVVVPNRIADGNSTPKIEVLLQGLRVSVFDEDGGYAEEAFTNNPAWVLLDLLRRSGWKIGEINVPSFAKSAAFCDGLISTTDSNGVAVQVRRFQCNLALTKRRSAAEIVKGIRCASGLILRTGINGQLELLPESAIFMQQSSKAPGTNSTAMLEGGWPAYEFGDGSLGFGGILRRDNGEPSLRVWSRTSADTPNRISVEFQDEFNYFQQDSLSLVDLEDLRATGQEISVGSQALGVPNFSQAARVLRAQLNRSVRGNTYVEFDSGLQGLELLPGDLITLTYLKEGFTRQPFRIVKIAPGINYATCTITAQIHEDEWYLGSSEDDQGLVGGAIERNHAGDLPRPLLGSSWDGKSSSFEIQERREGSADGSHRLILSAKFLEPPQPKIGGAGQPQLALLPTIGTGGALKSDQTLYYAISAVDAQGVEGPPSFTVRADLPAGSDDRVVTLHSLRFSGSATAFHVYRGTTPFHLMRIASNEAIATSFTDIGQPEGLGVPTDPGFHHANFFWRLELLPATTTTSFSSNHIGNSDLGMVENEYRGRLIRLIEGAGSGQERTILSNSATNFQVAVPWDVMPDNTTRFVISEESWRPASKSTNSPAEFEVPDRQGATIQISGRSANVRDMESSYELNPLTRYEIAVAPGSGFDDGVPGRPGFIVSTSGDGQLEVAGLAFNDLKNTRTIETATLTLFTFDEVHRELRDLLVSVDPVQTAIEVSGSALIAGQVLQIERELLRVISSASGLITVQRGWAGSLASSHAAGSVVELIQESVDVLSLPRHFFGSHASGSHRHLTRMTGMRLVAAELFVTNSHGNSEPRLISYTNTMDRGLRTLSGGQFTLQVEGYLAIESGAVPPVVVDRSSAVRDVRAFVQDAPQLVPIELMITVDGLNWCELVILPGQTASNVVDGSLLPALLEGSRLGLNVESVGATVEATPGRDLTVVVRL